MNATPTSKPNEPQGALARADQQLAHVHEQIARADEDLARLSEQLAKMERGAAPPPAAEPGPQSPPGRPVLRALVGLPLAAGLIVAALVLQSSYGDGAKPVVARWAPQLVSTSSLPPENPPLAAQSAPSPIEQSTPAPMEVAAAEAAPPQATLVAQTTPQPVAPAAIAAAPDQTQLLEKMARDLANMERTIEQLRANQQQIASDNSKAVQELKASQEEIKRVLAKVSEQNPPRTSSPPPPPPALRRPERTVQSPPVRARPRMQREWMYYDDW